MNTLRENMMIGLLVALTIGPSLTTNNNLSMAVRLSSVSLLAIGTGGRFASELKSGLARPSGTQPFVRFENSKPGATPEKDAA
jgi:hypothetical protein